MIKIISLISWEIAPHKPKVGRTRYEKRLKINVSWLALTNKNQIFNQFNQFNQWLIKVIIYNIANCISAIMIEFILHILIPDAGGPPHRPVGPGAPAYTLAVRCLRHSGQEND